LAKEEDAIYKTLVLHIRVTPDNSDEKLPENAADWINLSEIGDAVAELISNNAKNSDRWDTETGYSEDGAFPVVHTSLLNQAWFWNNYQNLREKLGAENFEELLIETTIGDNQDELDDVAWRFVELAIKGVDFGVYK